MKAGALLSDHRDYWAFPVPVVLVCVERGQSPRETTLGAPKGALLASFLFLVLPPTLIALHLELLPR